MPLLNSVVDTTRPPNYALPVITTTGTSHDLRAHDSEDVLAPQEEIQPVCEQHNHLDSSSQTASPEDTDRLPINYSLDTSLSEDRNDSGPAVHGAGITQASCHWSYTAEALLSRTKVLQGDIVPTTRAFVLQQDTAPMAVGAQPFFASPAQSGGTVPAGNGGTYGLYTSVYTPFMHNQIIAAEHSNHGNPLVVFEGGQYTTLDAFAGHNHVASDLGFVFGQDVFDYNTSGPSTLTSDLGIVFGNVQYTAGDVFGADYADSVPFESDLGFAF